MQTLSPWFCHGMDMKLGGWCGSERTREERNVGCDALALALGFLGRAPRIGHVGKSSNLKSEET